MSSLFFSPGRVSQIVAMRPKLKRPGNRIVYNEREMTTILKPTTRRTRLAYSVLRQKRRQIVVSLIPTDVIEFHELRSRKKFTLNIDEAFKIAVKAAAKAAHRKRLAEKKAKREGRAFSA